MISKVVYMGDLRTESIHLQSGKTIITDAPIDNQGKGKAFYQQI
jgi:putative redox protein